jgi:cytidyltransferase-like protein
MKKTVFVSGCYDILHGGHIQFFQDAKFLGTELVICYATDEVIRLAKGREPAMPERHRLVLLIQLGYRLIAGGDLDPVFNFRFAFEEFKPDILAVTDDDPNMEAKRKFCQEHGAELVAMPKHFYGDPITSTEIRARIACPQQVPLRVDFAGGWLDVPKFARGDGYIVNCTITPMVSLRDWPYKKGAGLGGSAALSILQGRNAFADEGERNVGWQDPAVIHETGLCVWKSGATPKLLEKYDPSFLIGRMALLWTGERNKTAGEITERDRDYRAIQFASQRACPSRPASVYDAVELSYEAQRGEGMSELPPNPGSVAAKYCGAGWGGYALYLFWDESDRTAGIEKSPDLIPIEPYIRSWG